MSFSTEEKEKRLEDWKQSGEKPWTYARKNGLIPQTLCRWIKQKSPKISGFVELPVQVKPKPEQQCEILVEKGDIKIHIPLSVWIEYPAAITEGLRVLA
jgi:transposase-like protein